VDGPLGNGEVFGANMGFRLGALGDLRFDTKLGHKRGRIMGTEEVSMIAALRRTGAPVVWVPDMRLRHYVEPSRMTIGHLTRHYHDRARAAIRTTGIPSGTRIAGVPRWLVGQLVRKRLAHARHTVLGDRVKALVALREANYTLGLIRESFVVARESTR
jgi:hypothetical protein